MVASPKTDISDATTDCGESPSSSSSQTKRENLDYYKIGELIKMARKTLGIAVFSPMQAEWCRPERVQNYIDARPEELERSSEIFCQALKWRGEHEALLSGEANPAWSNDLRVLTRGQDGTPVMYMCFGEQVAKASASTEQHVALVLEKGMSLVRPGSRRLDCVIDCHGFRTLENLDPRPLVASILVMRHPYRNCLRSAIIVDAPSSFSVLWRALQRFVSPEVRQRVHFMNKIEAEALINSRMGSRAGHKILEVMERNRSHPSRAFAASYKIPSEIDADEEAILEKCSSEGLFEVPEEPDMQSPSSIKVKVAFKKPKLKL